MRLFGYYACHAFWNQIRKLLKTWVLIFLLVCMVMGVVVGMGAGALTQQMENQEPETEQTQQEVPLEDRLGISKEDMGELLLGGLCLGVLTVFCLTAVNSGSKIFLPADVNLLFPSPMQPQSVLTFRLVTRMGAAVLGSAYLIIEVPLLADGASTWTVASVVGAWFLILIAGSLLQTFIYTACSTNRFLRAHMSHLIYGILAGVGVAYFLYWKSTDLTNIQAAAAFFNHPVSRYVPIWGWIKGFPMYAAEENLPAYLICLTVFCVGCIGMGWGIWHMKADFYEDALAKSQETAALMEAAQSEKNVVRKRKKDRSERLLRDGMKYGWGASVFFHRAMYNRFRFAHLHIFTKTSETYLAAALGVSALCRFILEVPGLYPVCLTLGVIAFFRALGNPLAEDTQQDFFRMIPESTWSKVFWSLLGGTANCLLDLLPAMAAASLIWQAPLGVLAWLPVIVSVDFFCSTVSAFINLSVPVSAGKLIKQLVIILFIYCGLLPDIGILAAGFVFHRVSAAAVGALGVNVALGFLFMALLPLFIDQKEGKKFVEKVPFSGDIPKIRRDFSKIGLALFTFLAVGNLAQIACMALFKSSMQDPILFWVIAFAPLYLVGLPACLLVFRSVPAHVPTQRGMGVKEWLRNLLIGFFLMIVGSLISACIQSLTTTVFHLQWDNPIEMLTTGQALLPRILFMVLIGPLVEELVFRKQMIDRMHIYGGKLAVVVSALLFGLFHGNLSQFFYAFGLGLLFGYMYLKTGRMRYSAIMHIFINFLGGVVGPFFLEHVDPEVMDSMDLAMLLENPESAKWMLGLGIYVITEYALALVGMVVFFLRKRKMQFAQEPLELPREKRTAIVFGNVGMLLGLAGCGAMIVLSFIP